VLLFGASHFWNSAKHGVGNDLGYGRERLIKDVVNTLSAGFEPTNKELRSKAK